MKRKVILFALYFSALNISAQASTDAKVPAEDLKKDIVVPFVESTGVKHQFHNIGLGFRLNNRIGYKDFKATSGNTITKYEVEYKSSEPLLIQYQYLNARPDSWGWVAGVMYTSVSWSEASVGNLTASTSGTTTILSPFGGAVFRWRNFYLPFGLNLTSSSYSGPSTLLAESKGSIGLQLGAGFIINDNFSFLIENKTFGYSSANYTSSGVAVDSGYGYLNGINFIAMYMF